MHDKKEENRGHIVSLMNSNCVVDFNNFFSHLNFYFTVIVQFSNGFDERGGESIFGEDEAQ